MDESDDFGFEMESGGDNDDEISRLSQSESESTRTGQTKISNSITYSTAFDAQTAISQGIDNDSESTGIYKRNDILRKLKDAKEMAPNDFIRLKCLLSSRFHPIKVESIMVKCAQKKNMNYKPQRKDAIAIAGMAKLYVGDLIKRAKTILQDENATITPDSLRQAAREWRDDNVCFFPK